MRPHLGRSSSEKLPRTSRVSLVAPHSLYGEDNSHDHGIIPYMTSFLARSGHFDSLRAAQTIWRIGKRRRPDWICGECRTRRASRQCREYSDAAMRLYDANYLFPESQQDGEDAEARRQHASRGQHERRRNWGLRSDDTQQETPISRGKAQIRDAFFDQHKPTSTSQEAAQLALWEQLEVTGQDSDATADGLQVTDGTRDITRDELRPIADDPLLNIDYSSELTPALVKGEADTVVRCLYAANLANDLDWLRSIPSTTFSEIIRLLEPNKFIAKLASAHIELSTALVAQLDIAPMREVAYEYTNILRQVVAIRRSTGTLLSLEDYIVLLRSARDLGNKRMSGTIFGNLVNEGHTPTTACYNYYMSAVVWNGSHLAGSRQKVRVTPFHLLKRRQLRAGSNFSNYRVSKGGVREVAMKIFNDMLAHGAIADEESFRILITAAAREGDINTVISILKRIWNIDVDAILEGQDEASIAPKALPEHSPLRPTPALLFTLAHAFGINNNIPAALRTVDFVARHYSLTITHDVWSQLFEWTFVLSIPRWGDNKTDGGMSGQLPSESLYNLWNTMTGSPYYVQPSIGMYNSLIKNLFRRKLTPTILEKIQEGIDLYTQHRHEAFNHLQRFKKALKKRRDSGKPHKSIEELRNKWEYADLIRQRDNFWVQRWLRLLLASSRDGNRHDDQAQLFCRELPPLLWRWRSFAPTVVQYEIVSGFVEIAFRSHDELLQSAKTRLAMAEGNYELTDESMKYVGNQWVRGRAPKVPRRLGKRLERGSTSRLGIA